MSLPATPEEIPHAFAKAWQQRDAKALAQLFAEDADFVNVTGLWWRKRSDIEAAHHYGLTTFFKASTLEVRRVEVRRLGDVAVVHCRFRLTGQIAPDGTTADPRQTILSFVAQKRQDRWVVVSAHNTDIAPGQETHVSQHGTMTAHSYRN